MRTTVLSLAAAAGLMFGTTAACLAQNGAQDSAPGQRMQDKDKGSIRGQPGASGYAPGQQMQQQQGSKAREPGASGYAPGHQDSTSGQGTRSGTTSSTGTKSR